MHFVSTLPYGSLSCFDRWWTLGFDMMHGWVFLIVAFMIHERKPNLSPEQVREQQARGKKGCQMASRLSKCYQRACFSGTHYNLDPIFILIWGVECLDAKEKQQICNAFRRIVSDFKIPCLSLQMPRSPKVIGWVGQHVAQSSKCWMFCGQHIVTLHSFLLIKSTLAVRWCIHVSTITTHLAQL